MLDGFMGFMLPSFSPVGAGNKGNAKWLNDVQMMEIFNRITNAALARFKWSGLPVTCDERALEQTLFFYGNALFFEDEDLGFIHTPVQLIGPFNVYYESINREAYSFNYRKRRTIDDSVLIRANMTMSPDYIIPWNYAPKIADAIRSVDVHSQTLKSPFGITCDEQNKRSAIAALNKIKDNEIAVFSQKYNQQNAFQVLSFVNNCWLPEMWANVKNYTSEAYTALGMDNSYSSKKERMVTSEAEGQSNPTRHVLQSELNERLTACEKINKMFGLNISCEINQENEFMFEHMEREGLILESEGGEPNVPED